MRLLSVFAMIVALAVAAPIFAQSDCCQCGPSACGPAPEGGDCSGCDLITNAICDGDTGQCAAVFEGAMSKSVTAAPALGGTPLALLAAAMTVLALSVLGHRRQQR